MPRLHPDDAFIATKLGCWADALRDAINDIRAWRDDPAERIYYGGWPDVPAEIEHDTAYVVSAVCNRYPRLDPQPLLDAQEAILLWHHDHNADRIPSQADLDIIERQCCAIFRTLVDGILARGSAANPEGKPVQTDNPAFNAREDAIIQALREHGPLKGEDLALKAGYEYSGSLKELLAGLVRRGVIANSRGLGYHLPKVGT